MMEVTLGLRLTNERDSTDELASDGGYIYMKWGNRLTSARVNERNWRTSECLRGDLRGNPQTSAHHGERNQ